MLVGAAMLGRRWGMLLALIDPGVLSILMLPPYLVMEAIRRAEDDGAAGPRTIETIDEIGMA
jgi:hypothetical protein